MSGTAEGAGGEDGATRHVRRVLNRDVPVESLRELYNGLRPDRRPQFDIDQPVAFGFDTNALFRLGLGQQGADALDYLQTLHRGPVVVPGQIVQEIWNNQLAGLQPKAKSLRQHFETLKREADGIDVELGDAGDAVKAAISELTSQHGEWVDPKTQETLDGTLEVLLSVAVIGYVPRAEFEPLAAVRKATKTPPGFKDTVGHGDFFVWADFLRGLAGVDPATYESIVFVTNDEKLDWSRNQVAHPVLVAEALALTGKPFRLWNLEQFRKFVRTATEA